MNVLMVASSYPKFPGDVTAPFIESIARAVAARGHAVDVLLPHHPDLRRPPGEPVRVFPYHYAPREDWSLWGYAQSLESDVRVRRGVYLLAPLVALALRRALGSLLADRRYDVVHAHWVVPNAAMVTDIVTAHHVPFVVSAHGSDIFLAERSAAVGAFARSALEAAGARDRLQRRPAAARGRPRRGGRSHAAPCPTASTPPPSRRRPTRACARGWARRPGRVSCSPSAASSRRRGFGTLVEAAAGLSGVHVAIAGAGDLRESAGSAGSRELAAPVRARRAPRPRARWRRRWRRRTWWPSLRWWTARATWTACPTRCWRRWPRDGRWWPRGWRGYRTSSTTA